MPHKICRRVWMARYRDPKPTEYPASGFAGLGIDDGGYPWNATWDQVQMWPTKEGVQSYVGMFSTMLEAVEVEITYDIREIT